MYRLFLLALLLAACGGPASQTVANLAPDSGTLDSGTPDSGTSDSGTSDAGTIDAGSDAGSPGY